jgi:hypothetical protein
MANPNNMDEVGKEDFGDSFIQFKNHSKSQNNKIFSPSLHKVGRTDLQTKTNPSCHSEQKSPVNLLG